MTERFATCTLDEIIVGEPLPCNLLIHINGRFITYRLAGDPMDRAAYDRFEFKQVRTLYIAIGEVTKFEAWRDKTLKTVAPVKGAPPMNEALAKARDAARRKAMDIFQSGHPDKVVAETLEVSMNLVTEVMRQPFAVKSLSQLQSFSQGTVDHSVNVSVLAVYLAMQMGYSHAVILQHVGMGGLLHDIGKTVVQIADDDTAEALKAKMGAHPELGAKLLDPIREVPNEVKMIVAQHHENFDGTGFPNHMKGAQIYDLARIVSIANVFDEQVAGARGSLVERQAHAIQQLDEAHFKRFDPQKLEKALKILRLGI